MQYVNCLVSIRGSNDMIIPKQNVPISEVLVLEHVHGKGAVRDASLAHETKMGANEVKAEVDRLVRKYDGVAEDIRSKIFPGARPDMPQTGEDIGMEVTGVKKKKKKTGKKDSEPSGDEPAGDEPAGDEPLV